MSTFSGIDTLRAEASFSVRAATGKSLVELRELRNLEKEYAASPPPRVEKRKQIYRHFLEEHPTSIYAPIALAGYRIGVTSAMDLKSKERLMRYVRQLVPLYPHSFLVWQELSFEAARIEPDGGKHLLEVIMQTVRDSSLTRFLQRRFSKFLD